MRYIKVLSMFVIIVVALLLISTIRTYAGAAVGLVQCDGNLVVIKVLLSSGDGDCDTGSGNACEPGVGNSCASCLEACLAFVYDPDIEHSGSGKVTFVLTE